MSLERIYLDYNATAPLHDAARAAMLEAMALPGNPSSIHAEGRAARRVVEVARAAVAVLMGVRSRDITFVSGGTEAANLLLSPSLTDGGASIERLLVGAGEHACVLQGHRFPADRVEIVPTTASGVLDLDALADMVAAAPGRVLLALQAANNETGVLQPVPEAAGIVHAAGGLVVCDAVQAAGRIELSDMQADALFISAHKIGGPKGAAALAFANNCLHIGDALVRGGGQERGLRAGTENVAAIAGFGVVAAHAAAELEPSSERLAQLRQKLEQRLCALFPELVVFGRDAPRLSQTSCFALPDVPAETLLIALDLGGVAVSSGSACSSGKVQPSHVLRAMDQPLELARGAVRVSLGPQTVERHLDVFCDVYVKAVENIRARRVKSAA